MPVITFDYEDFINILGYNISKKELVNRLPMIGADFDKIEGNKISIEFFPNRPDLASVEGIARASRAFFGFELGLKKYKIKKSDIIIKVDSSLKDIRPYVSCALVKNITMTDELISSLMDLQEKLHFGIGRNRKKVAIGVHNFDPIKPPFVYKAVDPYSIEFVPLGKIESMTLDEILKKHEKGIDYAHLLDDFKKYPLIVDSSDNVLSFPPIINGILTEVTPFTTDLFIDVTGNNLNSINYALNIITTALAERGGNIYNILVNYDDFSYISPDLTPKKRELSINYVNKILGTNFDVNQIINSLKKMGYDSEHVKKDIIQIMIPTWRYDILHDIDLVEDVSVGYGYDKFDIDYPKSLTYGSLLKHFNLFNTLRNIMIGLGYNEVTTFTISNEKNEFEKLNDDIKDRVQILNPISEDYSCLRVSLLPSLLNILKENRHHSLPQKIFELGIVVDKDYKNKYNLAAVKMDAKSNFSECKSTIDTIMRDIGKKYKICERNHPAFILGRCASISYNNQEIGFFGEIHPKTIIQFELEHPIIGFEIYTENILLKK
jgi:phenylalanyl-tRNA synthetase beta chain